MREIKFRVKDINGKWHVFGIFAEVLRAAVVQPGTLGQYTGVKDRNGVEICEGDVVASIFPSGKICSIGDVQFDCGVFGIEWTHCKKNKSMLGGWRQMHNLRRLDDDFIDNIEVIGNIHDNPELLEVEK